MCLINIGCYHYEQYPTSLQLTKQSKGMEWNGIVFEHEFTSLNPASDSLGQRSCCYFLSLAWSTGPEPEKHNKDVWT